MWIFRWIFMAIVMILIIGFAMQNTEQRVTIQFLDYATQPLPLWIIMYASFAVGVLFWLLVSIFQILMLKRDLAKQRKEIKNLKSELDRLRNVSIEEQVVPTPEEKAKNQGYPAKE